MLGSTMRVYVRKRDPATNEVTFEDFSADRRLSIASDACLLVGLRAG